MLLSGRWNWCVSVQPDEGWKIGRILSGVILLWKVKCEKSVSSQFHTKSLLYSHNSGLITCQLHLLTRSEHWAKYLPDWTQNNLCAMISPAGSKQLLKIMLQMSLGQSATTTEPLDYSGDAGIQHLKTFASLWKNELSHVMHPSISVALLILS